MCTVTYIPLSKNEFYLTSNRDEKSTRAEAIPPKKYKINNTAVYFPKDPQAGGTWIAASEKKYTLCLLNGANKNHIKKESYRLSRGQMLLDFFNYNDAIHFKQNYNFNKIEKI